MDNKVSIQIVTWNRCAELLNCLRTVYEFASECEVVLVDNASSDNTVEVVADTYPDVKIIRLHTNVGCPSARNIGVANCSCEYVYFLDDDGWITEQTISSLKSVLDDREDVAVVMSVIHEVDPSGMLVCEKPENVAGIRQIQSFAGGCSLIRRDLYLKYGGFPDDFFRQGEEEYLALRLHNAGYKVVCIEGSIMFHKPSAVNRDLNLFYYYQLRNSSITALRLYPFPQNKMRILLNLLRSLRVKKPKGMPGLFWLLFKMLFSVRDDSEVVDFGVLREFKKL